MVEQLLDLQGFCRDRGGTAHEVERLADRGLLQRDVVFDEHTDWHEFTRRGGRGPTDRALALNVDMDVDVDVDVEARDKRALQQIIERLLAVADESGH